MSRTQEILKFEEAMKEFKEVINTSDASRDLNVIVVDRERFTEVLNYTHRIWDDSVKIGIRYFCAKIPLITAIKESGYILIRNDGWSLACREEAFEEAFHLYDKSWDRIYRVEDEGG